MDELLKIKKQIRSWGLDINRVTLPNITEKFMTGQPDGEAEVFKADGYATGYIGK